MQPPDKHIFVTKFSGEKDVFSADKLRNSLKRSGASDEVVNFIVEEVKKDLYDNISTKNIYRKAFGLLRKFSGVNAGKYHIKRALMELGPSGFPFEKYIAEIVKFMGFIPEINQLIQGRCVTHEVDVLAVKDGQRCMIECKYHNRQGINCDVKVPLYIHSRFRDIEHTWLNKDPEILNEGWVVTNTKFSDDAIQYGTCAGLKLIGWNFPRKMSLQELIDISGLYPITCLTTLTKAEKERILASGTILCKDLPERRYLLTDLKISTEQILNIIEECQKISASLLE